MAKIIAVLAIMFLIVSGMVAAEEESHFDRFFGEIDLGGNTVNVWWHGGHVARFEAGGDAEGLIQEAEKKFNCTINVNGLVGGHTAIELYFSRLLAGVSTYDIWTWRQDTFPVLVIGGALFPVSEVLSDEYYDSLDSIKGFGHVHSTEYAYLGKSYSFNNYDFKGIGTHMFYNQIIFDKEDLPDPYELYKAGEWKWDVVTEIAKKATKDTTGDGEIDQFGLVDFPIRANRGPLYFTNDARETIEVDGRVLFAGTESNFIETLNQYREWNYELGVAVRGHNVWLAGKGAMIYGWGSMLNYANWKEAIEGGLIEPRVIPLPIGPSAKDQKNHVWPQVAMDVVGLPVNVEDPIGLVALQNYLFPPEEHKQAVHNSLLELAPTRQCYEIWMDAFYADVYHGTQFDPVLNQMSSAFNNVVFNGTETAEAAMARVAPEIQAWLNDLFNQ